MKQIKKELITINDLQIKKMVAQYQRGAKKVCGAIIGALWNYIYYYPVYAFGKPPDSNPNYQMDILSRLPVILRSYREQKIQFASWFSCVLRNAYLRGIEISDRLPQTVSLPSVDIFPMDLSSSSPSVPPELPDLFAPLSSIERIVIRMRYPELLRDKDSDIVVHHSRRSRVEWRHFYGRISMHREAVIFRRKMLSQKIGQVFARLQRIKQKIEHARYWEQSCSKLQAQYLRLERQHKRLLNMDRSGLVTFPIHEIARFLSMPKGSVSTHLRRAKEKIKLHVVSISPVVDRQDT